MLADRPSLFRVVFHTYNLSMNLNVTLALQFVDKVFPIKNEIQ